METFRIEPQSCDPALGCSRAYHNEAGADRFGDWLVDAIDGRVGSKGRRFRSVACGVAAVVRIVRHCSQDRATALKQISLSCRLPPSVRPQAAMRAPGCSARSTA
jgi:hypothetical protein